MDQENNVNNTENQEENKGQENNVDTTGQETEKQTEQEKRFTQPEVDALIKKRLERERSKQPPKEEMEAYKEWKKSQQTEQEKLAEERKEFESIKAENARLKNEKEVLRSGIDSKYTDYVTFEVGKMEGDFAENLAEFVKNNPQYATSTTSQTPTTQAGGQKIKNQGGAPDYSSMSDEEYFKLMAKK